MEQIAKAGYDQEEYVVNATPVATAVIEASPVAQATVAYAVPSVASVAAAAVISDSDDAAKAKYEAEDAKMGAFSQNATFVKDDAKVLAAPYSTSYDPELDRRIADEATRRGRQLAEEEIQQMRQLNRMAEAINNEEKMSAERAHLNALYQNYQEEIGGTTQTSATIPKEAYGVSLAVSSDESNLYPDSFGTQYDTATYETSDYEISEYKSVYDS